MILTFPKFRYVRSEPLMKAYRAISCQHCGRDDGTVCGAHSNWALHGHGRSIKASDEFCASLCAGCHVPLLDQGSTLSRLERQALWWAAHVKTVAALQRAGLWPAAIRLPDTERCPFDIGVSV